MSGTCPSGRLTDDGSAIASLVGGGLRGADSRRADAGKDSLLDTELVLRWLGADRGERTWVARLDDPSASYVVVPLCLGNNPTAAESTARQPFSLRLWSSEPLRVSKASSCPPESTREDPRAREEPRGAERSRGPEPERTRGYPRSPEVTRGG